MRRPAATFRCSALTAVTAVIFTLPSCVVRERYYHEVSGDLHGVAAGRPARIVAGLERGADALRAIDRVEEAEHLQRLAAEFRERHGDGHRAAAEEEERAELEDEIAVLRPAVEALARADRERLADRLERAIHARKVAIAGRHDDEAEEVRERAPSLEDQAEILNVAAKLFRDLDEPERASASHALARKLAERAGEHGDEEDDEEEDEEHEDLDERIEALQHALNEARDRIRRLERRR